ncbi:MAG: hypothetical protein A3F13_04910 [Gammaproteobacteria bacterium RIFCSPHIGHO2_12_FULL_40_19]|nr:MAG: hypothetical protein A3F13_04910 [Gammaproteobacteria bacterium RIFCSPHIGHO2_12_FULL_40_19]HLB41992.1 HGGxSTG domain-containing protein [Gammaproteobacteria bacterium]
MKTTSCTEPKRYAFDNAPRCGARTKRNGGNPCRSPAVRGKNRCRIHGGSKGSGAKSGNQNALKHGYSTNEAKSQRQNVRALIKQWRALKDRYRFLVPKTCR